MEKGECDKQERGRNWLEEKDQIKAKNVQEGMYKGGRKVKEGLRYGGRWKAGREEGGVECQP